MNKIINSALLMAFVFFFTSCEDFLEVEAPDHKIISATVFNNDETAQSAMTGIYNELFRASYSGGWENSVHVLAGLTSDELKAIRINDLSLLEFDENAIQPANERNLSLWASAYSIIYMSNSLLEGLEASQGISQDIKGSLEGESKFIRAFTYFYLVNLYGEVPLITTTDYRLNALAPQANIDEIYQQIIDDLTDSVSLLDVTYKENNRIHVNRYAAMALLARVHLYLENWVEAERLSSEVLSATGTYEILSDLDQVFLANSREAIWQISPIGGSGGVFTYTNEASTFIFHPFFPSINKIALRMELVNSFEEEDNRFEHWIGFHESTGNSYAFKYKDRSSMNNITEYSMVLRFAEQYLIRAEALAMQGKLTEAITDLDVIRERAGLDLISNANMDIDREMLIELIREERKKELFTEWGHRWLDLKRTGMASSILPNKPSDWEDTDVLFPIPAQERMKNPNLNQNPGY
jgi:hypothetical protein